MEKKVSFGTYLGFLWLVLIVLGGLVMYPVFMAGLAKEAQHAAVEPHPGIAGLISPGFVYYACVAQVVGLGFAVYSWLRKQQW